jgi:hypothetical protein
MSITNRLLPLAVATLSLECIYNRYKLHRIASDANMTTLFFNTYISFRYLKVEGEPESAHEECRAYNTRIVQQQLDWTDKSLFDRIVHQPPNVPPSFMHLKIRDKLAQK